MNNLTVNIKELSADNKTDETNTPEKVIFDCETDLMYISTLLEGADYLLEDLCDYFALDEKSKIAIIQSNFKRYGSIIEVVRALVSVMSNTVKSNIEVIDNM